jgi:hypothetical protein
VFSVGATTDIVVIPAPGYYIENVTCTPQGRILLIQQLILLYLVDGRPFTTLTNQVSSSYTAVSNVTISVTFASAAPTNTPPQITLQPSAPQSVLAGQTVTLSTWAVGSVPLNFQWQLDGQPVLGATNTTLILTNVLPAQAGAYAVTVSNPVGTTTSQTVPINIKAAQVYVNGTFVPNYGTATNANLPVTVTIISSPAFPRVFYSVGGGEETDNYTGIPYGGSFQVNASAVLAIVSYSADLTSSAFEEVSIFSVQPAVGISLSGTGTNATLIVSVTGAPGYYYQLQSSTNTLGTNLVNWKNCSGNFLLPSTSVSFTFTNNPIPIKMYRAVLSQ